MGKNVFANGMEIAHKAGGGKVIAAFPDVCLSPPPPPAGPVPVPYPNTSFAKDLKQGSTTVKIGGKPLALKDQSYYKSSPLGDEAATRNFGGSVVTHTITGATYFQASSMDVVVEGKNVCRHVDITTSNHASYPGSTPPMANVEAVNLAQQRIAEDKCPCCGKAKHANGTPMNRDEWYAQNMQERYNERVKEIDAERGAAEAACQNASNPRDMKSALRDLNQAVAKYAKPSRDLSQNKAGLRDLMKRAKKRPGCTCAKPPPPLLPSPPCDVFYSRPPPGPARKAQQDAIEDAWKDYKKAHVGREPTPPALVGVGQGDEVMHLTPKSAGGCPTGDGNLQAKKALCASCQAIDGEFSKFQA